MRKFKETLQKALDEGVTQLPDDIEMDFKMVDRVYRAIKITGSKTEPDESDFLAQAEIERISNREDFDKHDIGNYGCSFFMDRKILELAMFLPRKNKGIAIGSICSRHGALYRENSDHIMCFIYKGAKLSDDFKVVKDEEVDNDR